MEPRTISPIRGRMVLYQCEICLTKYQDYDEAYECCQETYNEELIEDFVEKWDIG